MTGLSSAAKASAGETAKPVRLALAGALITGGGTLAITLLMVLSALQVSLGLGGETESRFSGDGVSALALREIPRAVPAAV